MHHVFKRKKAAAFIMPDAQIVTKVSHYSDRLFSFRVTRPRSLRFRCGEFVMIGLPNDNNKPILRAYSIASPSWDDELEFYSIKVDNGPLTSRLKNITIGDTIIIRPKAVGTLVLDALLPGQRIYLIATGTGIAPFASLIRDPDIYQRYQKVILCHTCRKVTDLRYGAALVKGLKNDPLVGDESQKAFEYYPTTTRENSPKIGRISKIITDGILSRDLNLPFFNPKTDRVMICGSLQFNYDMKKICQNVGLREGSNSNPAEFVFEKAFVG